MTGLVVVPELGGTFALYRGPVRLAGRFSSYLAAAEHRDTVLDEVRRARARAGLSY